MTFFVKILLPAFLAFGTSSVFAADALPTASSNELERTSLVNFHEVNAELYRSGKLSSSSAVGELADHGIKTIISLEEYGGDDRLADKEARWAEDEGMTHVWYPMAGTRKPTLTQIYRVLELIRDAEGPVLVHCKKGADRTGIIVAAYRIKYEGWSAEAAIRELRDSTYGHSRDLYHWDDVLYGVDR